MGANDGKAINGNEIMVVNKRIGSHDGKHYQASLVKYDSGLSVALIKEIDNVTGCVLRTGNLPDEIVRKIDWSNNVWGYEQTDGGAWQHRQVGTTYANDILFELFGAELPTGLFEG